LFVGNTNELNFLYDAAVLAKEEKAVDKNIQAQVTALKKNDGITEMRISKKYIYSNINIIPPNPRLDVSVQSLQQSPTNIKTTQPSVDSNNKVKATVPKPYFYNDPQLLMESKTNTSEITEVSNNSDLKLTTPPQLYLTLPQLPPVSTPKKKIKFVMKMIFYF
jgi:hypothetical protein